MNLEYSCGSVLLRSRRSFINCSQKITFHGVIPQDQSGCLFLSLATTDCDRKLHETVWYRINGWALNVVWQSSVPY